MTPSELTQKHKMSQIKMKRCNWFVTVNLIDIFVFRYYQTTAVLFPLLLGQLNSTAMRVHLAPAQTLIDMRVCTVFKEIFQPKMKIKYIIY